jgi:hypothetical protein
MTVDISDELTTQLRNLESIVTTLLGNANHTEEELREQIAKYRPIAAPQASDGDCDELTRRLIARLNIDVERGVAVLAEDYEPWLADKRRDITWSRWLTYKQFLINSKWPPRVVEKVDELTDQILDFAGDPTVEGAWARRGLVLGDVQSGKTASYLALFNKAADAGYRLIIVLAGHTEYLRQQTQRRVDEGFIGRDTSRNTPRAGTSVTPKFIGVGGINKQIANPQGMTTAARDFTKSSHEATSITVDSRASAPYVFVMKKNKSVLLALSRWLDEQPKTSGQLDVPLLLLDDESDYASVNTREETNPTAINDAIRGILAQFSRSSYIAFTATPFANIFIDCENTNDLFPRDFIYALESPSNYVGAEGTFGLTGEENTTNVIELDDVEDYLPLKHKAGHPIDELPESLIEAIRAFFIANAIRDLRDQNEPRSMLINVSRFKRVQRQVFDLVGAEVAAIKNAVELHSVLHSRGERNEELTRLEKTYQSVYPDCEFGWEKILSALAPAVSDIRVQLYNSDRDRELAEDQVIWDRPKRLIAVGGDVLSRGLTLDGLSTSYFWRRTGASDTLLQMARWFGYRDGYHDLCRLWIDPSVAADYRFVADSVDELRLDLRRMFDQKLTPKDFGLAVRKHPGALLVTARNKMKAAETRTAIISLIGKRIETVKLPSDAETLRSNYRALESFLSEIDVDAYRHEDTRRGYRWWQGVPKAMIGDFLDDFKAHSTDELFYQAVISKFVRINGSDRFRAWDVVLVNGAKSATKHEIGEVTFKPPSRTFIKGQSDELRLGGKSARLAGADDLTNVMDDQAVAEVHAEFAKKEPKKAVPESEYYPHLDRPALLIYALRPAEGSDGAASNGGARPSAQQAADLIDESGVLVVALKLAFPGDALRDDSGDVEYVINSVALRTWFPDLDDLLIEDDVDA